MHVGSACVPPCLHPTSTAQTPLQAPGPHPSPPPPPPPHRPSVIEVSYARTGGSYEADVEFLTREEYVKMLEQALEDLKVCWRHGLISNVKIGK